MPTPKNNSGRDRLVTEVFHDGWSHGHLAAAAQDAARHVRLHRRMRYVMAGIVTGLLVVVGGRWATLRPDSELARIEPVSQPGVNREATAAPQCSYEVITDEQLASVLSNRKVLLVRDAGAYVEAVFLDR